MISVKDAFGKVMESAVERDIEYVKLEESSGRVLAEPIFADRDFPPFDRVCMDGICISSEALKKGQKTFELAGMASAGIPQKPFMGADKALEVMTGAILPEGYDIVVPYEEIETVEGKATLSKADWSTNANIHKRGIDRASGTQLLEKGRLIGAAEVGVLATVGKSEIAVYKSFSVAVVSTGDELVAVHEQPEAYQIRSSNSVQIATVLKAKGQDCSIYHINDDQEVLEKRLREILEKHDMLILSGGVSRGKLDYVPQTLEKLKVEKYFHRVAQKPGKPFWFGQSSQGVPVFAFPGNPVSAFLCLHKYCLPFIGRSMGQALPVVEYAELSETFSFKKTLTYFAAVGLRNENGKLIAHYNPGQGSGDLSNLMDNDAFIELSADQEVAEKGSLLPVLRYR